LSIDRYLIREVSKPFAAILGILVALFAGYSLAGILSDAVNALLPIGTIAQLTALKVLISLEVLIPISLYIAVVLAFGRLYADSEHTAMAALGMTPRRLGRPVLLLAASLAVTVSCLSLAVRPWAYATSHAITERAAAMLNVNAMEAGTFYIGQDNHQAIILTSRAGPDSPARDVFVERELNGHTEVIFAKLGISLPAQPGAQRQVQLTDAHIYKLDPQNSQNDQVLNVQGISLNPNSAPEDAADDSPVAASTASLARSSTPQDIAELQWRLSTGISTLLLGLLGMPLSRGRPRQSKYAKFGPVILVYSGYYLLCTSARTWVEHGAVARFPGLWWAPGLLALFLLACIYEPALRRRLPRLHLRLRPRGTQSHAMPIVQKPLDNPDAA
jgi:lipopolysaccharide export system permease protein